MACSPELRRVPELACVPEVLQECNDFAKEVPFLEQVEECEEVVYDDCVEVREKIPVEVAIQLSILSSPHILSTHLTLSHPTSTPLSPPFPQVPQLPQLPRFPTCPHISQIPQSPPSSSSPIR